MVDGQHIRKPTPEKVQLEARIEDRTREPATVQYEGEYEDHLNVHAPPKKTQYDKTGYKGINPEDL